MLTVDDITIDPEFSSVNRDLSGDERFALEELIGLHGFRDPLVVWLHHGLLLDGHNRLSIWHEHFEDDDDGPAPPDIIEMHFDDRPAALKWIKQNQRARRNLTPAELEALMGDEYREKKQTHGGQIPNTKAVDGGMGHSDPSIDTTAETIAKKYGVSPSTVKRNAQFAEAVETIGENAGKEVVDSILSGTTDKTRKEVIAIAKLPAEEQAAAMVRSAPKDERGEPRKITAKLIRETAAPYLPEKPANTTNDDVVTDAPADAVAAFKVVTDSLKDARKQALALCDMKCGPFIRKTFVKERFQQIIDELAQAVPERNCTICNGEGCMQCRYYGLIPARVYEETREP